MPVWKKTCQLLQSPLNRQRKNLKELNVSFVIKCFRTRLTWRDMLGHILGRGLFPAMFVGGALQGRLQCWHTSWFIWIKKYLYNIEALWLQLYLRSTEMIHQILDMIEEMPFWHWCFKWTAVIMSLMNIQVPNKEFQSCHFDSVCESVYKRK